MIARGLLEEIRHGFALCLDGIHGESHWERVRENGLRLARQTGADTEIVELFAYLHDSKRQNDGWDREHGQRAAVFIHQLQGTLLTLSGERLTSLTYACAHHSDGLVKAGVTIQTCWDADRLDLGRVNIKPDARWLCTDAAKDPELIAWAYRRSRARVLR
jgi:uncharacterized protein